MTGAELKTLRESMGLSQQWMASNCPSPSGKGVNLRSYQRWESGDAPVPDDAALFFRCVKSEWRGLADREATDALDLIDRHTKSIDLYRYRSDHDVPDHIGMPAAFHALAIKRAQEIVERQRDVTVSIVYAEADRD